MKNNRKVFLQQLKNGALGMTGLHALSQYESHAADLGGYKALVCVFLFGGMDNHDTIIPYDQINYNNYSRIRSSFISRIPSRQRSNLLPLNANNSEDFNGRQFALPSELKQLHQLFEEGNAAVVGNVGPLLAPLNKTQFEARSQLTPKRLFSHNDQQSTWLASQPEGAVMGWGGRLADVAVQASINGNRDFTNIATYNNQLFLNGLEARPYQISLMGSNTMEVLEGLEEDPTDSFYLKLEKHFNAQDFNGTNLLARDVAAKMKRSHQLNLHYQRGLKGGKSLASSFPNTHLGLQLQKVAETIAVKDFFQMNRQVFFVGLDGFDTHDRQVVDLPKLHRQLDDAISSFYSTMKSLQLEQSVTLFTASDFGRSLVINGDGTDHGWGGHHFVVGGAVNGKRIYGELPKPELNSQYDAGHGRLIPSVSVEQYAEPLGRWFGLNSQELNLALPNLSAFQNQAALEIF